ncbi:histidine ammonia-lyase [Amycolatopsis sp. CA-128772]|uniref:HAL/PAL/TAL family ammonia-lyase n=1 Tax=Amycolatopsis sp. CA-128772 TaxID=2073159 RepID=UPI001E48AF72|nr:aromatic amino acid ammonia-lyase [Amycolatopsis sp. CA-128772]
MGDATTEDRPVILGEGALDPRTAARVAAREFRGEVRLSDEAAQRVNRSAELRRQLVEAGQPLYGVTTGFGDSARRVVSSDKAVELQLGLAEYHRAGVGPLTPPEVVRAAMLIRANCLARGSSGVRRGLVELMLSCLAADLVPVVPQRGSVGASGDLTPLCYIANALLGRGEIVAGGERRPASEALRERGLTPWEPEPKEVLALINGTSFSAAFAVVTLERATRLADAAEVCTAMACEALDADRSHYDPVIHQHKPHPGQRASAATLLSLLDGSRLAEDHPASLGEEEQVDDDYEELDQPIQEPYSLRCAPQVVGVLRDTLDWTTRWLEVEINSVDDNPLFDPDTGKAYSGGNFYAGHVGQAMDSLKVVLASVGDLLDRQVALLVDEKYNRDLTPNLIPRVDDDDPHAGLRHGFKAAQITCSALAAEALKNTMPATVFSRSTECHNQDKVSMGTIAARDAYTVVELVENIAAVHLLASCQALDLRGADRAAPATKAVHDVVREHVRPVEDDRGMEGDFRAVAQLLRTGAVLRAGAR